MGGEWYHEMEARKEMKNAKSKQKKKETRRITNLKISNTVGKTLINMDGGCVHVT